MSSGRTPRLVLLIALVPLVLHLWPNPDYGYFRDELYYLACAARPALGYVDHPPLAPLLLALQGALLGDSVTVLRLLPALASAALVLVTARTARCLGGGAAAQVLAATATALAPGYLVACDFYSMNCVALVLWAVALHLFVVRVTQDRPRTWLAIGAVLGIALLNKHTVVLLALALGVGLLLSRWRRDLVSRWLWGGVAISVLLSLPNLLWQVAHDFPSLEFYRNAQAQKNVATPPHMVVLGQVLVTGPTAALLWLAGAAALLCWRRLRALRAVGWAFAALLAVLVLSGASRPDRIGGVYPVLFAAGATWIEAAGRRWLRRAALALVAAGSLVMLPLGVAALPSAWAARYAEALGSMIVIERGADLELPQWLADRRGWEELAGLVARAHDRLTDGERAGAVVLASNYGLAGALERFGPERGLPPVVCPHNSYYHWSLGRTDADVTISVGFGRELLDQLFADVELVGRLDCPLARENGRPVYVAREPRVPLSRVWDQLRFYL